MNHIYRLVWSRTRLQWIVASEHTPARGKSKPGRSQASRPPWLAGWSIALSLLPSLALAALPPSNPFLPAAANPANPHLAATTLPTGGKITNGSGRISQDKAALTVTQQSQYLSLNWQSFNIGAQATVNFVQPGADAIAVNRIADTNGSQIFGHLNANGQVFLINPNGVLFGQGAQVNVGGLVASTLDVDDSTLGGSQLSFSGNGHGKVVNQGTITTTPGGYVALLGNQVGNQGWIHAQLGSVALAGGSAITLSLNGDTLVDVRVEQSTLNALAQNGELIQADGGQVWMTAGARDSLLASVVNNTGTVEAQTVANRNGTITLLAGMQAGTTNVGGALDASAPSGGQGGAIETSASAVHIASDAVITTKATQGQSGNWLIDPFDFTIAASGGDMTGAQLSTELASGNITIASSNGTGSGAGNINVDDAVSWNANTLTLTAANNININAVMTASGSAGLALNPATANGSDSAVSGGTVNAMPGSGRVDFTGSGNTLSINGTPYTIITSLGSAGSTTGKDLQGINGNLGGYYALGADIDASTTSGWNSGAGFIPISTGNDSGFSGVLDGLGHTINGLTINSGNQYVGLFNGLGSSATLRNVGLQGGSVTGNASSQDIGALIGYDAGTVLNVYTSAQVTGTGQNDLVGGLAGVGYGLIQNAYVTGAVSAAGASTVAGGLVGYNFGTISNAYVTGTVSGNGVRAIGGLLGSNLGTVTDTYAVGAVSESSATFFGGLIGISGGGSVANSYWDTQTTGMASSSGGTSITSAQLQSGLPEGFSSSAWGIVAGKSFPYLLAQFPANTTPQVVSGTVYTDNGTTNAGTGIAISGVINGSPLISLNGAVQTDSNGYYYFLLAPNTLASGESMLVYAHNYGPGNSINGAAFLDNYSGSGSLVFNIDGGIFNIQTRSGSLSALLANLATTEGNGATADIALANADLASINNLNIVASSGFTLNHDLSAATVALNVQGDLILENTLQTSNTLRLTSAGNIVQSGGSLQAGTLTGGASGDVALTGSNSVGTLNAFQASGSFELDTSQSQPLTLTGELSGNNVALKNLSGNLQINGAIIAPSGIVTLMSGGNILGGASSAISAAALVGSATQDASLTGHNGIATLGAFSVGGEFTLVDQAPTLTISGPLSASTEIEIGQQNGSLIDQVGLSAQSIGLSAGGALQVANLSAASITLSGSSIAINGQIDAGNSGLALTSSGAITQSAAISSTGPTAIFADSAVLTNGSNALSGQVTLGGFNGAVGTDFQLVNNGTLTFRNVDLASFTVNATGALNLGTGNVGSLIATSDGAITQSGALTGTQVNISAGANAITLDNANNSITGEVSLSNSGANNVVFNNGATALDVGDMTVGAGTLTLSGNGISQAGAITQAAAAGATNFNGGAGNIILDNTSNGLTSAVSLSTTGTSVMLVNGSNALMLGNISAANATLNLQAGAISQSSDSTITANTLTGSSTGNVSLTNANAISTLDAFNSGGSFSLHDGQALTITGTISSNGNPLALETLAGDLTLNGTLTATGNTLQLISNGGIACGACAISAGTLTGSALGSAELSGGTGGIHINTFGSFSADSLFLNNNIPLLTLSGTLTTDGSLVIVGSGKIVDSATVSGNGVMFVGPLGIAVNSDLNDSGNLQLYTSGLNASITLAAPIVASGYIDLEAMGLNASITQSAPVKTYGGLRIDSNAVTLTNVGNILSGPISGAGKSIQLTSSGALDFDGLSATSSLVASADGSVTQDGLIQGGTLSINAGNHPIILGNASNSFSGEVSLSNSGHNDVTFNNGTTALDLGDISVGSGALTLSGNGISQSSVLIQATGAGGAVFNGGTGDVVLNNPFNDLTGIVSTSGADVTLFNDINPLVLGNINVGGTFTVQAGGITQANGTTISAGTFAGAAGGALVLANANNVTSLSDISANSFTLNNATALTINGSIAAFTGDTSITTSGDLTLSTQAVLSGNNVTLVSGGVFTNHAGAQALTANSGVWQIWSQRPEADSLDGLAFDFKQYNAAYGSSAVLGTGNGVFYTEAPVAQVSLVGDVSKTYDGSTGATLASGNFQVGNLVNGDDGNVVSSGVTASYDDANAGYNKRVTASGWDVAFSASNGSASVPVYGYQVNTSAADDIGTITPAPLTVTAAGASKVYDGVAYSGGNGISYSGFVNGETAATLGGILSYGGDAQGATDVGNYSILPGGLTSGNYSITYAPGRLSITPAPLIITANDASKVYDGLAYTGGNGVTYSGFVNGETSTVLGGSLSYTGNGQGAIDAGSYILMPSGLISDNYSITFKPGQLSVARAPLTITANNADKVYDGLGFTGGNGVSYSGLVNGEAPSVLSGTLSYGGDAQGAVNVGDYAIEASGLSAGNYRITYMPGQLSVTPAPLTISANNVSKVYDGLAYAGNNGVTYSGFVNGETASVLGGMLGYGGDAQGAIDVGNYVIEASGLSAGNYRITYVPGQLSVTPAPLTVSANNVSKVYDGLAYAGNNGVTYSGFVNGETASVLGGMLGYGGDAQGAINVGNYVIEASGLSAGNYRITYVPGQLSVTPASLTVTANSASKVYDGLAYAGGNGVSYSGFVNGETPAVLSGALSYGGDAQGAIDTGHYTILPSGLSGSNYTITYVPAPLSVTPASLTVSVNTASKTYDAQAYAGGNGVTYAGFVDGQDASVLGGALIYGGSAQGAINVGNYVLDASGLISNNYSIHYVPDTLTITPAMLTYVASPMHLYSGEAPQGLSGMLAGFLGGDTVAGSTTGTLAWSTPATAQSQAGQYAIVGSGLTARNYVFSEAPSNATALTIGLDSMPAALSNAIAGVQQQLGSKVPFAMTSTSGERLRTSDAAAPAPAMDASHHAVPPFIAAPYAPDVRIAEEGMRLP